MGKLRYLLARILKMNYRAMFNKINIVHKKTKKNRFFIFLDVIYCGLKYQAGYIDYELFEMYNLNSKQRKTILTRGINNSYIKKYNNSKFAHIFRNKNETNKLYNKFLNRDWLDFNNCDKEEFEKFIYVHDEFVIKPIDGTCGKGIEKIKTKEYTSNDLFNYIKDRGNVILEELIVQHPKMNKMYANAINTLRIVTFLKEDNVNIVTAYLRVGNGSIVDNFNSGGMVVPINVKTGKIEYNALDKKQVVYERHPATGTQFIGFQIPMWEEALELVRKMGTLVPQVRLVGWDIAISSTGPCLVEINDFPGHDIYQLPPHRTNGIGVLPDFEKIIND